jgi:hypothetical protein
MRWIACALLAAGCEGAVGPQGDEGVPGEEGAQGDAGEQGAKGEVGTAGTVDPTTCTLVENSNLGGASPVCPDDYFVLHGGCDSYNGSLDEAGPILVNKPQTISPSVVPNSWECLVDGVENVTGYAFCCPMP